MEFQLFNDKLKVTVNSKGAELTQIVFDQKQYLWEADPSVWPRHAPVLFPVVGKLKNDSYTYQGNSYELTQHGFAREMEFSFGFKTNTEIQLTLTQTEESLKKYPFEFKLDIGYKLVDDTIVCSYRVDNTSLNDPLYFSIGAHPGFKIPLDPSEAFEEYELLPEGRNNYRVTSLNNGLITDLTKELQLSSGKLKLSKELFDTDALVFENGQVNSIELRSNVTGHGVRLESDLWPYFGIWSKKGCDRFVCLEPWFGIADHENSTQDLTQKKGIIKLEPKGIFNAKYTIQLF